jgi:UDP-3-O-[3-hydroxymyristoyl] glucosamine N-acyltransferase
MQLREIASHLNARLEPPDAEADITAIAAIEAASPGEITFIANLRYAAAAKTTKASAIIVDENFSAIDKPLLRTRNPQLAYARAVELFYRPPEYPVGIHPSAIVHPSARIGKNASIAAGVVIDADVSIGENCTLLPYVVIYRDVKIGSNFFAHSHVSIRESSQIGNNVLLHNGVVIGSDGFGFAKDEDGRWRKIPQSGIVVI